MGCLIPGFAGVRTHLRCLSASGSVPAVQGILQSATQLNSDLASSAFNVSAPSPAFTSASARMPACRNHAMRSSRTLQVASTTARALSGVNANDVTPAQLSTVADILATTAPQLAASSSAAEAMERTNAAVSDLQQILLDRLVSFGWTSVGVCAGAPSHAAHSIPLPCCSLSANPNLSAPAAWWQRRAGSTDPRCSLLLWSHSAAAM